MKFERKYAGKWVAAKDDKVIAADKTLTKLVKKIKGSKEKDDNVRFALIPKGFIAG